MQEQCFDELYFDFWRDELLGARLQRDCDLIVKLGQLSPSSSVLDLGSGMGRISVELGNRNLNILGVERSECAVREATRTASPRCRFINEDWRKRPWTEQFDCVLLWFTTLCAGRSNDLQTLALARASLLDRGSLLIETRHWDRPNRQFQTVTERRSHKGRLIERHSYDPTTGIQTTEEQYDIAPQTFQRSYQIRRYSFAELREMCLEVGFEHVEGYDQRGSKLSDESERAVLCAHIGTRQI